MCVGAGVQLQVLHVFAVQLHVELLQGAVPLPQSRLQAADALHVLLHQAGLQAHACSRTDGPRCFFSNVFKRKSNAAKH